jgi:hypothetical protein
MSAMTVADAGLLLSREIDTSAFRAKQKEGAG